MTISPLSKSHTFANMILVLATSRGVVSPADTPPAMAPHTAPCHGSMDPPWLSLTSVCKHNTKAVQHDNQSKPGSDRSDRIIHGHSLSPSPLSSPSPTHILALSLAPSPISIPSPIYFPSGPSLSDYYTEVVHMCRKLTFRNSQMGYWIKENGTSLDIVEKYPRYRPFTPCEDKNFDTAYNHHLTHFCLQGVSKNVDGSHVRIRLRSLLDNFKGNPQDIRNLQNQTQGLKCVYLPPTKDTIAPTKDTIAVYTSNKGQSTPPTKDTLKENNL